MANAPRPWTVTRHDPLEQIDENLFAINGDVPGFPAAAAFPRRMSIVRLKDARLLFHNAIPVDDATLAHPGAGHSVDPRRAASPALHGRPRLSREARPFGLYQPKGP